VLYPYRFYWSCVVCANGARIEPEEGLVFRSHGMVLVARPDGFHQRILNGMG
jgi:hypothetical protein